MAAAGSIVVPPPAPKTLTDRSLGVFAIFSFSMRCPVSRSTCARLSCRCSVLFAHLWLSARAFIPLPPSPFPSPRRPFARITSLSLHRGGQNIIITDVAVYIILKYFVSIRLYFTEIHMNGHKNSKKKSVSSLNVEAVIVVGNHLC